jgi:hypothetical protein
MPTPPVSILRVCLLLAVLAGSAHPVLAQRIFSLSGGPVELRINAVGAGGELVDAIAPDAGKFTWQQATGLKVTVSTSAPGQSFRLFVRADGVVRGTPTGEIMLLDGMLPVDLVVDIPNAGMGGASLHYRASANVLDGHSGDRGIDTHTVTYTIVAQ